MSKNSVYQGMCTLPDADFCSFVLKVVSRFTMSGEFPKTTAGDVGSRFKHYKIAVKQTQQILKHVPTWRHRSFIATQRLSVPR